MSFAEQLFESKAPKPRKFCSLARGEYPSTVKNQGEFLAQLSLDFLPGKPHGIGSGVRNFEHQRHELTMHDRGAERKASTEPRSFERGDLPSYTILQAEKSCFNGAAFFRTRKESNFGLLPVKFDASESDSLMHVTKKGFNQAVSVVDAPFQHCRDQGLHKRNDPPKFCQFQDPQSTCHFETETPGLSSGIFIVQQNRKRAGLSEDNRLRFPGIKSRSKQRQQWGCSNVMDFYPNCGTNRLLDRFGRRPPHPLRDDLSRNSLRNQYPSERPLKNIKPPYRGKCDERRRV